MTLMWLVMHFSVSMGRVVEQSVKLDWCWQESALQKWAWAGAIGQKLLDYLGPWLVCLLVPILLAQLHNSYKEDCLQPLTHFSSMGNTTEALLGTAVGFTQPDCWWLLLTCLHIICGGLILTSRRPHRQIINCTNHLPFVSGMSNNIAEIEVRSIIVNNYCWVTNLNVKIFNVKRSLRKLSMDMSILAAVPACSSSPEWVFRWLIDPRVEVQEDP